MGILIQSLKHITCDLWLAINLASNKSLAEVIINIIPVHKNYTFLSAIKL